MAKAKAKDNKALIFGLKVFGLILCLFLLFSCISFDIADSPSGYVAPNNSPATNWCGRVGAFVAFYTLYYVGPGVFIVYITAIAAFGASLSDKKITQPVLRFIGLLLLTATASTTYYLVWPDAIFRFPFGSGGTLGVACGKFLKVNFATLGTALILMGTWVVSVILLADSLVLTVIKFTGITVGKFLGIVSPAWAAARERSQTLGEIWEKLSVWQKEEAARPSLKKSSGKIVETITVIGKDEEVSEEDEAVENTVSQAGDLAEEDDEEVEVEETESKAEAAQSAPRETLKVTTQVARKPATKYVPKSYEDYQLPPIDALADPEHGYAEVQERMVKDKAALLEKLLTEFNINARVVAADSGPVITMYELELSPGIKVSQITNLANDMARGLGAGSVRVVAPLPGKHTIGIEVPNSEKEKVRIKDLMHLAGNKPDKMQIPLFLGKDSQGEALVTDLAAMPHLLIAGTTGSGKSVCINSIIVSVCLTKRPDEVQMILVDPKMVEMTAFNTIPHLMCPIITEIKRAEQILEWATVKMDERYALLAEAKVKNIASYNALTQEEIVERFNPSTPDEEAQIPKRLPYIVIIIDELADLMMTAGKEVEAYIVRLAQKSRAVGIHLVLATQRPQATVVTGLIKANMPARISFRVAARMDSRIILDQNGAEALLGQGDMLFLLPGTSDLMRAQGSFIDDTEVKGIVKHLKDIAEPQFHPELTQLNKIDTSELSRDDMFDEAVDIVLETKRGSVSLLQRRLSIGYARASRIIEMMAAAGILGEYKGSQAREVTMSKEEWERVKGSMEHDRQAGFSDLAEDGPITEEKHESPSSGQLEYIAAKDKEDTEESEE
jgi:DNA segregation ATPase FtsK/SpoIIIE, S-DNA-T family